MKALLGVQVVSGIHATQPPLPKPTKPPSTHQQTPKPSHYQQHPQGDIIAASPNFSHVLPTVFDRPLSYEPERFAPPREEDKRKPFSFIGFGGGRHACIGQNFAYLQIKAIWAVLLRNFDFELLDPVPDADYDSMVIGPKPCRVRYVRRKLQA